MEEDIKHADTPANCQILGGKLEEEEEYRNNWKLTKKSNVDDNHQHTQLNIIAWLPARHTVWQGGQDMHTPLFVVYKDRYDYLVTPYNLGYCAQYHAFASGRRPRLKLK